MSLKYIFGKPSFIDGVGNIYPVRMKDWDEFEENIRPLLLTKKHFQIEEDVPLLDLIVAVGFQEYIIINNLENIFKIVLRTENVAFVFDEQRYAFIINEESAIHSRNYDEVRKIIMHQNLLFEPKVYKSKVMQEWAEKVLEARRKNAPNITLEEKITTIAAFNGKHYWDLEEYTIYQIEAEFARICAFKNYDTSSHLFARDYVNPADIKLDHFAEKIDLFKNPYDDLFKSKDKLKNINKALKG